MTPDELAALAKGLTEGKRKALIAMPSEGWEWPGKTTFNAQSAWALWNYNHGICERDWMGERIAYRLTPTGLALRAYLLERG